MKEIFLDEEQYSNLEKFSRCVYASIRAIKTFDEGADFVKVRDGKGKITVPKLVNYPSEKHLEVQDIDNMSLFYYKRLVKPDGITNLYMKEALKDAVIFIKDKVEHERKP